MIKWISYGKKNVLGVTVKKKYPWRYSYYAIKHQYLELGREYDGTAEMFDFEGAESILWYGFVSGCKFAGVKFDLKREDMEFILDQSLYEFIDAYSSFRQDALMRAGQSVETK